MPELPFWLKLIAMTLALPLMAEFGYRLQAFLAQRKTTIVSVPTGEDLTQFVSGALALLSLLLAFSVSGAAERFEFRRELVATEATQFTTAYLRSQLFPEPVKMRLGRLLAEYVDDRRAMILGFGNSAEEAHWGQVVERDQKQIWEVTSEALATTQSEALKAKMLDSINPLLDSADFIYSAMKATTPKKITLTILVFSLWTAVLVGYHLGVIGKRYPLLSTAILLMFAWTAMLIDDIDYPGAGFIGVDTAPLARASDWIARSAGPVVKAETNSVRGARDETRLLK